MKFKVGDKVVPISKNIGTTFENSNIIHQMKVFKKPYAVIIRIDADRIVCNLLDTDGNLYKFGGDHFLESDLKLYQEDSLFDDLNNTL